MDMEETGGAATAEQEAPAPNTYAIKKEARRSIGGTGNLVKKGCEKPWQSLNQQTLGYRGCQYPQPVVTVVRLGGQVNCLVDPGKVLILPKGPDSHSNYAKLTRIS